AISGSCPNGNCTGTELINAIRSSDFNDSLAEFKFFKDTNGAYPRYSISQLHPISGNKFQWNLVGRYLYFTEKKEIVDVNSTARRYLKPTLQKRSCPQNSEPIFTKACTFICVASYFPSTVEHIVMICFSL